MTTPYIEAKKAELRNLKCVNGAMYFGSVEDDPCDCKTRCQNEQTYEHALEELEQFFVTLLDEIESRVVPMEALPSDWDDDDKPRLRASMYNNCRKDVLEAFQHLRTGVTE